MQNPAPPPDVEGEGEVEISCLKFPQESKTKQSAYLKTGAAPPFKRSREKWGKKVALLKVTGEFYAAEERRRGWGRGEGSLLEEK